MKMKRTWCCLAASIIVFIQAGTAFSWETSTHKKMNLSALNVDYWFDSYLMEMFIDNPLTGNYNDLNSMVNRKMVAQWIQEGGAAEDSAGRYINHFHDPLMPWDRAGLNVLLFPRALSSVVWAQLPRNEQGTYAYSWQDAREYHFQALTGERPSDRLIYFQQMFKALGHVMHLVEDAAVPEHSRNDWWHGPDAVLNDTVTFERWTERNFDKFSAMPFQAWQNEELNALLTRPGDREAPIPISRLVDANILNSGERPSITGATLAGISEYSNSNFLSNSTLFENYEYPSIDCMEPLGEEDYLTKTCDGEIINHFVRLNEDDGYKQYSLGGKCYEDYATLLVPKAISYASRVTSYFFRGMLDLYAYHSLDRTKYILYLYNFSSEPLVKGKVYFYGVDRGKNVHPAGSYDVGGLPPHNECSGDADCEHLRIEIDATSDCYIFAVFRGELGLEKDAVVNSNIVCACCEAL
jgi:hypothetical protein